MNPQKFGDSYDFLKRVIIPVLVAEDWAVHPMYFDATPNQRFLNQYSMFLDIDLVDGWDEPRSEVSAVGQRCQNHLFLDPDTGLRVPGPTELGHGQHRRTHLNIPELVEIATARGREHRLTLVYDQSYPRHIRLDDRLQRVQEKLTLLHGLGVYGDAYVSHVAFIWVSASQDAVAAATRQIAAIPGFPVLHPVRRIIKGGTPV